MMFIGVCRLLGRLLSVACGMYRYVFYGCVSADWEIGQRMPERQREAQRGPERHREDQRSPEKDKENKGEHSIEPMEPLRL